MQNCSIVCIILSQRLKFQNISITSNKAHCSIKFATFCFQLMATLIQYIIIRGDLAKLWPMGAIIAQVRVIHLLTLILALITFALFRLVMHLLLLIIYNKMMMKQKNILRTWITCINVYWRFIDFIQIYVIWFNYKKLFAGT